VLLHAVTVSSDRRRYGLAPDTAAGLVSYADQFLGRRSWPSKPRPWTPAANADGSLREGADVAELSWLLGPLTARIGRATPRRYSDVVFTPPTPPSQTGPPQLAASEG
jgi:hypothetical protein